MGFTLAATIGTADFLHSNDVVVETLVAKVGLHDGAHDAVELIASEQVQLVINTPSGRGARADGAQIRSACMTHNVPCLTTMAAGLAAARGIADTRSQGWRVTSLQELHS